MRRLDKRMVRTRRMISRWTPFFVGVSFLVAACGEKKTPSGEGIIQKAMKYHGVERLDTSWVEFDFRDKHYVYRRRKERFQYKRIHSDTFGDRIRDVLNNEGFNRYVNDTSVSLSQKDSTAFLHSVNSVIYFAFLPYRLDDAAVIPSYEGRTTIEGRTYEQVKVEFTKKGGGKDHEDTFMYWFRKKDGRMDYFAYRYHTEGGGARFRKTYDQRRVKEILFQDHYNMKAPFSSPLKELPKMFMAGELDTLSKIEIENIQVRKLSDTSWYKVD